jgi:hypothetical protein
MPLNRNYEPIESWSCEACCHWMCQLVPSRPLRCFSKIRYRCPKCNSEVIRYYDLQRRGYLEAAGIRLERTENEGAWVDCKPCFNRVTCPRKAVTRHIKKGLEIEDFIDAVALAAPGMNDRQLPRCFVKLFGPEHLRSQVGRFRKVYNRVGDPPAPSA